MTSQSSLSIMLRMKHFGGSASRQTFIPLSFGEFRRAKVTTSTNCSRTTHQPCDCHRTGQRRSKWKLPQQVAKSFRVRRFTLQRTALSLLWFPLTALRCSPFVNTFRTPLALPQTDETLRSVCITTLLGASRLSLTYSFL